MVAPLFLAPILAEASRCGVPPQSLLRGLEIDLADLAAPDTVISHHDAITVVRRAIQALPIADRGLELGRHAIVTERGALALGLLASATLGDAIGLAVRFPQSAGYLLVVREGDACSLIAEPFAGDQDLQRFLVDLTFLAMVQLRRQITQTPYAPSSLELVHDTPANAAAYSSLFRCPVQFGGLKNAIHSTPASLATGLPWANAGARCLSAQLLAQEFARFRSMSSVAFAVERAIRRNLPHAPSLVQMAASLNLSERTLRRQLAQEGLSYRQLLDASRRSRAFDLLTTGHRALVDIAAAVGFSDGRAFARAFRRWTGHVPSVLREFIGDSRLEQGQAPGAD